MAFVAIAAALTIVLGRSPQPVPEAAGDLTSDEVAMAAERHQLVDEGVIGWGIDDPVVIDALRAVRRHLFVPDAYIDQAYANHPLPIGYGQTISQPYIVALMTEALEIEPGERVLEIGTGSGYQAAVLAEVGAEVFTVEIIEPLAESAAERLSRLGYTGIQTRTADGYDGWPEEAPFDAIIVTAAPDHIPQPLLAQLVEGGVLVIPVGPQGGYQELWKVTRTGQDTFDTVNLGGVRFVPLVHSSEGFVPEE